MSVVDTVVKPICPRETQSSELYLTQYQSAGKRASGLNTLVHVWIYWVTTGVQATTGWGRGAEKQMCNKGATISTPTHFAVGCLPIWLSRHHRAAEHRYSPCQYRPQLPPRHRRFRSQDQKQPQRIQVVGFVNVASHAREGLTSVRTSGATWTFRCA